MNRDRQNQIAELLKVKQTVSNAELMEMFSVSIETVRRDLAYLEKQGVLKRVYGGAVRKNFLNIEPEYQERSANHAAEKNAIAKEAEKLIQPNDTLFFDVGTTVPSIARFLDESKKTLSFTNSLRLAMALSEKGCDVMIAGGRVRGGEFATAGFMAENNMKQFNFDKVFVGAGGIDENGITDFVPEEAHLRNQIIQNARMVIAMADYSKFGVRAICNVCTMQDVDVLITDESAPQDILKKIEKCGVQVIVAKVK